ncbi:hypothetical protein DM02DRAFT_644487 [Periconia macrospinosa]|uniref:GST N-terminal domain-containing protein n=1 Tax=Periconia macrospinosa TaxID=97972 RepID=A0A2V1DFN4_9PLEO|nr:hypothetical protein DM02DRAFT_644487 [Periconia macrospinosa]
MTSEVHIYMCRGSCSFASHILLREAGVPFTHDWINVKLGFPRDKLHLNPKGAVPIIILDGETITETPAILTAISQFVPSKQLLGRTNLEIVRSYEWMNWISGKLHGQAFAALFRPAWFVDSPDAHEIVQRKATAKIRECFEMIEGKLDGRKWGNGRGFEMDQNFPNYARLARGVAKRDSVVKAAEVEGIDVLVD